ncbi:hypothetical protein [Streptomyces sp. NPDC005805]|uniref:hypothetical protein n=1 Tax=Streptomyces sp. NPDC005805 TaxID=3157068 RepID=UPI0033C940D8
MTHSGQGDEQHPRAARPAHEGVVLPADGSEPLIPGAHRGPQAAPTGGQPWGEPWGPPQGQPPAPGGPGAGHGSPAYGADHGTPTYGADHGSAPAQPGYGYPPASAQPGPGHPGGAPAPLPGQATDGYGYGSPAAPGYGYPGGAPAPGPGQAPAPAPAPGRATGGYGYPAAPAQPGYGYPGPDAGYGVPVAQPLPPQHGTGGYPGPEAPAAGPPAHQTYGGPGPLPAAQVPGGDDRTQLIPPVSGGPLPAPGPSGADDHTQLIPPQTGAAPVGPGAGPAPGAPGASDATQYLAPVRSGAGPGALPPERPAESTTFLGTRRPAPEAHAAPGGGADDATQYIAPVPPAPAGAPFGIRPGAPGDRQPPAEFDSLFRSDAPYAAAPADATAQLPRMDAGPPASGPRQTARHGGGHRYDEEPPYRAHRYDDEPPERRRSAVPVVAALVIGCAVLGLGVGAVMFGGDDSSDEPDKTVAASSSAPVESSPSSPPPPDPAKNQAEALDKLLADSNNSRAAVIRSVENIKQCTDLDQAVTDLKDAAAQRRDLVTRLGGLTVDALPNHAALTASLNEAWQASASADDHYAAWAEQAKGKKVCRGGKARATSQTAQGNRASGEATRAKNKAAPLWNAIAREHGLTERRSQQL